MPVKLNSPQRLRERKDFFLLLFFCDSAVSFFHRKGAKTAKIFYSCYSSASLRLYYFLPQRRQDRKDFFSLVIPLRLCGSIVFTETHRSELIHGISRTSSLILYPLSFNRLPLYHGFHRQEQPHQRPLCRHGFLAAVYDGDAERASTQGTQNAQALLVHLQG